MFAVRCDGYVCVVRCDGHVYLQSGVLEVVNEKTKMKAELNFHRMFEEAMEDFSLKRVADRQAKALANVGLEAP